MLEQLYKENIEMEHLSLQIITKQARSLFNIHECCEKNVESTQSKFKLELFKVAGLPVVSLSF